MAMLGIYAKYHRGGGERGKFMFLGGQKAFTWAMFTGNRGLQLANVRALCLVVRSCTRCIGKTCRLSGYISKTGYSKINI